MKRFSFILFFGIAYFVDACESKTATTVPSTKEKNPEAGSDPNENNQDSSNTNTNDETENTNQDGEVALITESRARSIMAASCIAGDCHGSVDDIFTSENMIFQLENNIMPPPEQARYTLSDQRRAELVLFFNNQ